MVKYQLKPSLTLLCINLCLYLLAAIALLVYYEFGLISLMLFFLTILLFIYNLFHYRQEIKSPPKILSLNLSSALIEWQMADNYRQFTEYSVYTCRWGMILVLKQSSFRRHIILLADCFDNNYEYLDLRYHLIRLNQVIHAS